VVIHLPPYRYRFDFSQLKGRDLERALEDDLRERDFTANAMAVNLDDVLSIGARQTLVFDPTGGMRDLEMGVLRPVSLENLRKDPVRVLRGYRLSVEKELHLTEDFYSFVNENLRLVLRAAPERITHELFRIMKTTRASELKKIENQGDHHLYSLEEHTLRTLEELEKVIEERTRYLSAELLRDFGCQRFLGEFTDLELLKFTT